MVKENEADVVGIVVKGGVVVVDNDDDDNNCCCCCCSPLSLLFSLNFANNKKVWDINVDNLAVFSRSLNNSLIFVNTFVGIC